MCACFFLFILFFYVFCITCGVFKCVWLICQQSWYTVSTASLGWLQLARHPSFIILWILCNLSLASSSNANESFIFFHSLVFLLQQIRLVFYQLSSLSTSTTTPLLGQNHRFAALWQLFSEDLFRRSEFLKSCTNSPLTFRWFIFNLSLLGMLVMTQPGLYSVIIIQP